jgi:hypothetical protein
MGGQKGLGATRLAVQEEGVIREEEEISIA